MHTALSHTLLSQALHFVAQLFALIVGSRRLIDHLNNVSLSLLQLTDNALPHFVEVTSLQQHVIDGLTQTGIFSHHFAPTLVHHIQLVLQLDDALLDAHDLLVVFGFGQFGCVQLDEFFF